MTTPVWYAAYGSNLSAQRFARYLEGGRAAGAQRTHPGARDATPPSGVRPVRLPGQVFFAGESSSWGGGVAYLDVAVQGEALGRAYRITDEQLADVVAQEMHREPGEIIDLPGVLAAQTLALGDGDYETLHVVGELDGEPVLTFTCPDGAAPQLGLAAPSRPYVEVIARGLLDAHDLQPREVLAYLEGLPGVRGEWTSADLRTTVLAAATAPA
ncbi:hypothetical protein [Luteipulveratus halotolerans]|uniref:Histone deacetylase n=1 Tax=Luteipulveratus halotolerans TaxID=1631356 RepID=A0A0L6CIS5_9MICO|nr:hypothetical protein [Luteipulveratus halotolerans]KNX37634.1 hypothetical protein VV01_11525 [Luteipulveratus halotolerans]